jgi:hypothetical protein
MTVTARSTEAVTAFMTYLHDFDLSSRLTRRGARQKFKEIPRLKRKFSINLMILVTFCREQKVRHAGYTSRYCEVGKCEFHPCGGCTGRLFAEWPSRRSIADHHPYYDD